MESFTSGALWPRHGFGFFRQPKGLEARGLFANGNGIGLIFGHRLPAVTLVVVVSE